MALTAWSSVSAALKSKVQNIAVYMKGIGTSELYLLEVDSTTGAIPTTNIPATVALKDSVAHSFASGNVGTGAWVQMIASTAAAATQITISESFGTVFELGIGAALSESRILLVPEGGLDTPIPLAIPAASRLSLKAITGTADSGYLVLNLLG